MEKEIHPGVAARVAALTENPRIAEFRDKLEAARRRTNEVLALTAPTPAPCTARLRVRRPAAQRERRPSCVGARARRAATSRDDGSGSGEPGEPAGLTAAAVLIGRAA